MNIFKKKSPVVEEPKEPKECEHKYQDFPWYIEISDYGYGFGKTIDVIEPYVCIKCKQRKNENLAHYVCSNKNQSDELLNTILTNYKDKIRSRIEIEDMIHDFIYVDNQYLKYWHMVNGTKDPVGRESVNDTKPKLKL